MIISSLLAGALLSARFTVTEVFLAVGLANVVVASYIFLLVPEYLLRFVAFVVTHTVYRLRIKGEHHLPIEGAAVIACNHVSYVDAIVLMAASPRPIRFVMDHRIFATPVLGWLFKLGKAIPIAPQKDAPEVYERALAEAAKVLAEGDLLGIFPEGGITKDGTLQPFKGGLMKILERQPAPVIPVALNNLWGSYFSRIEGGQAMVKPFRRGLFSRVGLNVGPAMAAGEVTPDALRVRVAGLLEASRR
jgi:1-acyl-sn-glycerol-3-phosphate acyltransferase